MSVESFKKPFLLENHIRDYSWGGRDDEAYIPRLLDMKPEPGQPYAELWMGSHPAAPSQVHLNDQLIALNKFIGQYPIPILGDTVHRKFGSDLPFLFKVLSASEALSIQAHPNKAQAEKLHQRDPDNYPDDNHKPEIAVAVDELTALVGFCPEQELQDRLRRYPELTEFIGETAILPFMQATSFDTGNTTFLKDMYRTLMHKAIEQPGALEEKLVTLEDRLNGRKGSLSAMERWFMKLRKQYGCDVGLFSIFFMNLLHLDAGQGVYLMAGIPHAYLQGNIIECMANSDNVVRAGLTPKFKDIKTLTEILTYQTDQPRIFKPGSGDTHFDYIADAPEFMISRYTLKEGEMCFEKTKTVRIAIVLSGSVELRCNKDSWKFKKGQVFMIPAAMGSYSYRAGQDSEWFVASVPVR